MKKSTFTPRTTSFMKSLLYIKILLLVMTVFFIHQFMLIVQLLLESPFSGFRVSLSLFVLSLIGWIIHTFIGIFKSRKARINNANEPLDNYLNCLLITSKLEEEVKQKNETVKHLRSYQNKMTKKHLEILTRNVLLKVEIKNVVKALQKDYKLTYECHKCGSLIGNFEQVEYHSEVCTIQIN